MSRRIACLLLPLALTGCGAPASLPVQNGRDAVSLVDRWSEVRIDDPVAAPEVPPRAEIRFDGKGLAGIEWSAVNGVADLRVEDGRLLGTTTSTSPVILLEIPEPVGVDDELWSAKVTLRALAGTRLGVHPVRDPGEPIPAITDRIDYWPLSSPLVAGEETKTYSVDVHRVFTLGMPIAETAISRVLVRPTNVAGTDFAIESVRLEFRREHLASIPSGPAWHGLGEVFRETLVSRAPETLGFEVTLPERPWLDLAVGAVELPAPRFRVEVAAGGKSEAVEELEVERPDTWRQARIDLSPWAGKTVELRLTAVADPAGAAGTLAFWGAPTIRRSVEGAGERPRAVVVFLADTLRRDHLEAWGHERETAPTLSRLAAEGVRFTDVVAQATWTKVSVSSILTSLYPATTGVFRPNDRVAAGETTLAEAFRAAGYATFATSSVPFTGQLTNLHQGVEVLYESGALRNERDAYQSKTSKAWVDVYLEWLERHRDVPSFAVIHVMDPHSPFEPPAPYDTMWADPASAERFARQAEQVAPHIRIPLLRRFMAPTREELAAAGVDEASFVAHEKAWYDGSIRHMDAQLERLVARLGELGLAGDCLLAFVADHGEEFLEHGQHWHGSTVYGEVTNVPLVLWGRGVPRGRLVEETVQNVDVMPTLLELAGLEIPERAQGRSLVPLMSGHGDERHRPAFVEFRTDNPERWNRFAIVKDGWKLIWNEDPPAGVAEHELYDRATDPLDLEDVAAAHPEVVAQLADELERWRAWAEEQKLDAAAAQSELSAEELERLRSLGYVE